MEVLLLTDIHGDWENLEKIVSRESFDAVLCAGDLSDASEFDDYQENLGKVLDVFEGSEALVKAVPGNMDLEDECVRTLIDNRMNLHKKIAGFEEFEAVGFGGGLTPFDTPFEPEEVEIRETIELLYDRMSSDVRIAVIHQPPENTALDVADGIHVGSSEVRTLLENTGFDFLLTGHIHESFGVDELSDTILVNPGPVFEGRYGILTVGDELDVELKRL